MGNKSLSDYGVRAVRIDGDFNVVGIRLETLPENPDWKKLAKFASNILIKYMKEKELSGL